MNYSGDSIPGDLITEIRASKKQLVEYLKKQGNGTSGNDTIPIAEISDEGYILSSSQRRLWLLCQVDEVRIAYNMATAVYFNGDLNIDDLSVCVGILIRRHEILRTVFREDTTGEPRQFVIPPGEFPFTITYADLRMDADREHSLAQKLYKDSSVLLDFENGPLFHLQAIRLENTQWLISFVIHHIISDGWSMDLLTAELLKLYKAAPGLREKLLAPMRLQYKDFAVWQQSQLKMGILNGQQQYWISRFSGSLPVLQLMEKGARPPVKTYNGAFKNYIFNRKDAEKIRLTARQTGTTLYMNLLSLVYVLINKFSGQSDIVLGTPIAGRNFDGVDKQLGFYVNSLPLRLSLNAAESYFQLLENVRKMMMEAFENQDFPFDELVASLNLTTDRSRNPLFDVVVVLQNANLNQSVAQASRENNSTIPRAFAENTRSLFDLTFDFREYGEEIMLVLKYNTDLFTLSQINRLSGYFELILSSVLAEPSRSLEDLPIITEADYQKVLYDFNHANGQPEKSGSLIELIEKQVSLYPDRPAVSFDGKVISYQELDERSGRLANLLMRKVQIVPGMRVGLLLRRTPDLLISILAILKAGGCYLPLDHEYPEERLLYMLEDAGATTLITESALIESANRLLWRGSVRNIVSCDSEQIRMDEGLRQNELMSKDLWNYIGRSTNDLISLGGWKSSYTGLDFSKEEMKEYAQNAYHKLRHLFHKKLKVLEIGCSSGLTLFEIAPFVGKYVGTDLSDSILTHTRQIARNRALGNVELINLAALDIDQLEEEDFDVVILNSVVQCFNGPNYLFQVLRKVIAKLKDKGVLFLGDLMDEDKRLVMISELSNFKEQHAGSDYQTKTDFSAEFFLSKGYIEDLIHDGIGVQSVAFSDKVHQLENELTKFRFDAILHIDKSVTREIGNRHKFYYDLNEINNESATARRPFLPPDSPFYVIYTSGSTGSPKGVMVEERAFINLLMWYRNIIRLGADESVLLSSPICFDLTQKNLFLPLLCGAKLVLPKMLYADYNYLADIIESENISVLNCAPSAFYPLLEESVNAAFSKLKSLNLVVLGGEPINKKEFFNWRRSEFFNAQIINSYGPTECTDVVSYYVITPDDWENGTPVPIGRPVDLCCLYVLDRRGAPVPPDVAGEIFISGICVSRGYLNSPTLNADKFLLNPFIKEHRMYKTGDLGKWTDDGDIVFLGRADDQVKIRGNRIELGEIETTLMQYSGIETAVVRSTQSPSGNHDIIAYYTGPESVETKELRSFLSNRLAIYMLPSYFVFMERFPLNPNGKIDRKSLPPPNDYIEENKVEIVPPRNDAERILVSSLSSVLRKNIGNVKDDFFALGGDSIKAIKLISDLRKKGLLLSIRDVMLHPIIEELAILLNHGPGPSLKSFPAKTFTMSPIQKAFFERSDEKNRHHFNQSVLIEAPLMEAEVLKETLNQLVTHHDYLRANFYLDGADWKDKINESCDIDLLTVTDYDESSFEDYCEVIQASFYLESGPLFKAALFKSNGVQRLLLVAHHLIIDGVSWRVLLEDLANLYDSIQDGRTFELPGKTLSFNTWKNHLTNYADSEMLTTEKKYWDQVERKLLDNIIHTDYAGGVNLMGDISTVTFSYPTDAFRGMLVNSYSAAKGSVNEFMISALALACSDVFSSEAINIKIELHGRENSFDSGDVSCTVGWFTTEYPVVIDVTHSKSMQAQLELTKLALCAVPNQGTGYGLLRYTRGEPYFNEPQISFNYLGEFDTGLSVYGHNQKFSISTKAHGRQAADSLKRLTMIDLWGVASADYIVFGINYSEKQFAKLTMERLSGALQGYISLSGENQN